MSRATLRDFLEYLYKAQDEESTYHNHKETLGWAAIAVFVAGTVALIANLRHPSGSLWADRGGTELGLAVAFLVVLGYARRQFNMREWAARLSASYSRLVTIILGRELDLEDAFDIGSVERLRELRKKPTVSETTLRKRWIVRQPSRVMGAIWASRVVKAIFPSRVDSGELKGNADVYPPVVLEFVDPPDTDRGPLHMEGFAYGVSGVMLVVASLVIWNLTPSKASVIISANQKTFPTGVGTEFLVKTTGAPPPTLSEDGLLPAGVTFTDKHNGTAILAGTPEGTPGGYEITITAANGVLPDAIQNFILTVGSAQDMNTRCHDRDGYGAWERRAEGPARIACQSGQQRWIAPQPSWRTLKG